MKLKKALSSLLALVLLLSCMSITAFAENVIDTITIEADTNLTSTVSYADDKNHTINIFLNGYTVTASSDKNAYEFTFGSDSTVNIYGGENAADTTKSGRIAANGESSYSLFARSSHTSINIYGGTVDSINACDNKVYVYGGTVNSILADECTGGIHITGGTVGSITITDWGSVYVTGGYIGSPSFSSGTPILSGGYYGQIPTSGIKSGYVCKDNKNPETMNAYPWVILPQNTNQLVSTSNLDNGGVSFTVGGNDATAAANGSTVTATAAAVEGYNALLSVSDNVTDFNASTGTFTMPDGAVTVTATYTPAACDITNGTPESDKATNNGYITVSKTSAEENEEVTVKSFPVDGYKLDKLEYTYNDGTKDVTTAITGGKFSMPAYAVTVNANFSQIVTSGTIDLDLEDSTADIPVSTTIDQYYTKVEASSTVDTHRIGVTWWTDAKTTLRHNNLVVQVNNAVKWNPTTLSWVEDEALNGVASVQEGTDKVNFKLSNYSTKAFTCSITYAANTEDTYANKTANTVIFDNNNGKELAKVENDINNPGKTNSAYTDENGQVDLTKVPTLTITGTVGVDLDGFKNAETTSSAVKYGSFTVTCTAVTE